MANIQPFDYQKRTNIEEHNQLVNKVNEIVEVINDTNLDTINSEIATLQSKATATDTEITNIKNKDTVQDTDISNIKDKVAMQDTEITNIKDKDTNQDTEISNIKNKDAMQDTEISNIKNKDAMQDTEIQGITKSLVSDAVLMNGTTTGNMKVRIERTDAPSIDSNEYNIQKPVSVELVQGSASAMVKAQITLSDGTVLISDDFMFTTESIGTDVYISSFVFKNGNIAGSISADIGLSNGSTLTANNFIVPTDPNVISSISDLQSRMTAVESGAGELTELKNTVDGHTSSINNLNTEVAELNSTVGGHTSSINNLNTEVAELNSTVGGHTSSINNLNTEVADLKTDKADVNNGNQSITAGTINANNINKGGVSVATINDIPDISGKVNIAQGTENAGKVLGVGADGNVTPVDGSSGGEVWEEVDLNNWPTDWAAGDRIKFTSITSFSYANPPSGWNAQLNYAPSLKPNTPSTSPTVIECLITDNDNHDNKTIINIHFNPDYKYCIIQYIYFNKASNLNDNNIDIGAIYNAGFNGNGERDISQPLTRNNISNYIGKMWRKRASA